MRSLALFLFCLGLGTGAAAAPSGKSRNVVADRDPWEKFNRRMFALNDVLDRAIIKPIAKGYVAVFPAPVRNGIRHVLDNLDEPVVFVNCVLEGRGSAARAALARFSVNSTLGLGGIADVATRCKIAAPHADFGQTLWTWGCSAGPYLVLPVFGPSSPRDGIGSGVDAFLDPWLYVGRHNGWNGTQSSARRAADGLDERARNLDALDEIKKEAVDYYASFRSFYQQNRAAELTAGEPAKVLPPPDFYADPGT